MEQFLQYFKPKRYDLELVISRESEELKGKMQVVGELVGDVVKFHAVDMVIKSVKLVQDAWFDEPGRSQSQECDYTYDSKVLTIPIARTMRDKVLMQKVVSYDYEQKHPSAIFRIEFETKLNRNMQGCYLSTYEWEGKEQKVVATQFESHYAREAFPCIDEPAAKAIFDLTLVDNDYSEKDVVLANTPVARRDGNRFRFAPTPKMSTYLLAWVIGPFKSVSSVNKNGVRVSSYCALNQNEEDLLFANQTAMRALEYYDKQFDEKYPLEKLDQVALPDFEAGAMENWGLVTYRESMMLASRDAAIDTKRTVATTVTHELSHQWFGDLVTMQWWDDLWLNESFATIIEYYCADALYPELEIWQDFYTGDCLAALRRDCLRGVQAVKQEVHHPSEIATLFDGAIVYAKGARLILMLIKLMGEEKFFKGIRYYFNKYKYGNTVGDDLWDSLQVFADFNVREFMDTWISQPGYPALQFCKNGDTTWWAQQRLLVDGTTDESQWPLPEVFDDMSGHYVLELSDEEFNKKLKRFDELELGQKLRILIDRMLLAKATIVESASLLDILESAKAESSAAVWDVMAGIMNDLKLFCPVDSKGYRDYQKFLRKLIAGQLKQVGLTPKAGENSDIITLRNILLSIARYAEDEKVMQSLADMYHENLEAMDSELRFYILSSKLYFSEQKGETGFFDYLLEQYQKVNNPRVKADIRRAMTAATLKENTAKLLDLLEQPKVVRPQDHVFLFVHLLRNNYTRKQTIDWLISNWDYVEKLTGEKSVEDYLRYAAGSIREAREAEKFYQFFDKKADDPILKRAIKMAHTEIDARLSLIRDETSKVQARLAELVGEAKAQS